jgi:alginate O-acetyltransferase complex protein AlgJ
MSRRDENSSSTPAPGKPWRIVNRGLVVVGFLLLLLLPTLYFGHPGAAQQSLKENRRLAEFPKSSLFFFQHLEKWYADHFGGRSTLIYYGARWQMDWIGIPGNRNVLKGREQWLFYDQYYQPGQALFADFRGKARFSPEQLTRIRTHLLQTQQALARCSIGFYLVMPPDKQTIYPDMMPFRRAAQTETRADQLFAALRDAPELKTIDLRPPLQAARKQESLPVYLKTDTHWNALGAFHSVQALMHALQADGRSPATGPQRKDYILASQPFAGGDIAVSLLSLPGYFDDVDITLALPGDTAQAIDHARLLYRNPQAQGRLLLYGDSFSEQMLPFLAQRFGHVAAVRRAQIDARDIKNEQPDVVVLEVLERLIGSLETGPTNLPACESRP